MCISDSPYTGGARVYQKTANVEGTIPKREVTTAGVLLTINDISGNWQQGSLNNNIVTNGIVSSKTQASITVTASSRTGATYSVGDTVTGATSGATAEVVSDDGGDTGTIVFRYVSKAFTAGETLEGDGTAGNVAFSAVTYSGDAVESSTISNCLLYTSDAADE